jgi:hypothetical protein
MTSEDTYQRLIDLVEKHEATYRLIDHPPEGRTELVSAARLDRSMALRRTDYVAIADPRFEHIRVQPDSATAGTRSGTDT